MLFFSTFFVIGLILFVAFIKKSDSNNNSITEKTNLFTNNRFEKVASESFDNNNIIEKNLHKTANNIKKSTDEITNISFELSKKNFQNNTNRNLQGDFSQIKDALKNLVIMFSVSLKTIINILMLILISNKFEYILNLIKL